MTKTKKPQLLRSLFLGPCILLGLGAGAYAAWDRLPITGSFRFGDITSIKSGGYSFSKRGEEAVRKEAGELESNIRKLVLDHRFGAVSIEPAGEKAGWSWELRCRADTKETAARLAKEAVKLVVATKGETLSIKLQLPPPPARELTGLDSRLILRLPKEAALSLKNGFGPTRVRGFEGAVEITAEHGAVALSELAGPVKAAASFGPLTARKLKKGAVLSNEHGAIEAAAIAGRLEARTEFGPLTIDGAASSEIVARNEHGAIAIAIGAKAALVDAATSFGELRITGLGKRACRFRAKTSFGDLTPPPGLAVSSGRFEKSCQGGTAEAGLAITLANEHGDISVK